MLMKTGILLPDLLEYPSQVTESFPAYGAQIHVNHGTLRSTN